MHEGERDPVTGQFTTGHNWNGIEELDSPVPKVVLFFLGLTILISVICWLLYPTFPLLTTYTKGLLGIDQQQQVIDDVKAAAAERAVWEDRIASASFSDIQADSRLMAHVSETGKTLFEDNCAACHGINATGGPGFPNLAAKSWLWGGDVEQIAETIRVGINSTNDDTRVSQMMAFGRDGMLQKQQIEDVVDYVLSLSGTVGDPAHIAAGKDLFAANCASCHGDDGKGMMEVGAPDLTDRFWIYGGDRQTVFATVYAGRQGHMPHWDTRLSPVSLKILALYVDGLGKAEP